MVAVVEGLEIGEEAAKIIPEKVEIITIHVGVATREIKIAAATIIIIPKIKVSTVLEVTIIASIITEGDITAITGEAIATTEEDTMMTIEEGIKTRVDIMMDITMIIGEVMVTITREVIEVQVEVTTLIEEVAEVVIALKIFNNLKELKLMILFKPIKRRTLISMSRKSSTMSSIHREVVVEVLEVEDDQIIIVVVEVVTVNTLRYLN